MDQNNKYPETSKFNDTDSVELDEVLGLLTTNNRLVPFILFSLLSVWVVVANLTISSAVFLNLKKKKDKPLLQWELYIASLDIGDILIGIYDFPMMATSTLLEDFPYGEPMCRIWIFLDNYLSIVSQIGYLFLLYHFIWQVRWPLSYLSFGCKIHHKLAVGMWTIGLILWIPPFLSDFKTWDYDSNECFYHIEQSFYISLVFAVFVIYIPLLLLILGYVWFIMIIRKDDVFNPTIIKQSAFTKMTSSNKRKLWDVFIKFIYGESFEKVPFSSQYLIWECKTNGKGLYKLIVTIIGLYIISKIMFCVYFTAKLFYPNLLDTTSGNVLLWIIRSHSPLSPLTNLVFDEALAKSFRDCIRKNRVQDSNKINTIFLK